MTKPAEEPNIVPDQEIKLDPEFEAELAEALACDPAERIERLGRLVQGIQDELDKHEVIDAKEQ